MRCVQLKQSNYDTDLFQDLIQVLCDHTSYKYGTNEERDIACRVIVDHLRAIAFTVADGQLPSNTGAGYVIRRILRRAVRYGYTRLQQEQPFMYKLLPALIDQMGDVFPELNGQRTFISKVMYEEESNFLRTLGSGIKRFQHALDAGDIKSGMLSGTQVVELS